MIDVLFVLPSLAGGGAERVVVTLLRSDLGPRIDPSLVIFQGGGPLARLLPDRVPVHDLRRPRLRHAIRPLIAEIRRRRPRVVVSTLWYVNLALLAARRLLPPETAILVREATMPSATLAVSRPRALIRLGFRRLYPRAAAVLCSSAYMLEEMRKEFSIPRDRLRTLPNPVDVTGLRDAATPPERTAGSGPRFVAAGRLTREKGFDRLIALFPQVPRRARLNILGEGPDREALRAQVEAAGLAGRIDLPGYQANPWPRYAGADAFLMPSRWEGMPNATLEALACGTPVIATPECGGLVELARETPAGSITIAGIDGAFGAALRRVRVRNDKGLRPSLLPARFDRANVAREFAAIIDSISAGQPG